MKKILTLLIPVKKEKESLGIFLRSLNKFSYNKILIVDRDDKTNYQKLIKKSRNTKIYLSKKTGYGNALIEGINIINTKYFCIINADGSMNPKEIKGMMKLTRSNSFIFGSRYMKMGGSEDDTLITLIGNKFFSLIGNIFFKLRISDILYTFVIGETKLARKLKLNSGDFKICVELPIKVHNFKYKYNDFPCYELKRIGGKKKVNAFKDGFLILTKMINLFFKRRF
tara:strand:+ start:3566 stop:4243 length:678 start_codon:yes stop_codon:yes gene_type:complete